MARKKKSAPPPLGFITPEDRSPEQEAAHAAAEARMLPRMALPVPVLAKGQSVRLFDFWSNDRVVRDIGFVFPRFHQLTGSCVGAGGGQALFTLIAVQCALGKSQAIIPWWPFNYGRSRLYMGAKNPGEGSMGSTFARSVVEDGVVPASEEGLPTFKDADGLVLTKNLEMTWSDGDSSTVMGYADEAKPHPMGSAARCGNVGDVKTALCNGYPCSLACDNYVGKATVKGTGTDACVVGYWDTRGGHQVALLGYWEHPTLGPLYLHQNNWPASSYPKDPAGGPPCSCWVTEGNVAAAMGMHGEVYAFSQLDWFPPQPELLSWMV